MARKCKREKCGAQLPAIDGHVFCESCRNMGKGDDPCVKGRSCKVYEAFLKAKDEEARKKRLEDELLGDSEQSESASQTSFERVLAKFSSKLDSFSDRLTSIENNKNKPSTASASVSHPPEPEPVEEISSDHEDSTKPESIPDREADPSLVEVLQAVKSLLDLPDTLSDSIKPPAAFYKKPTMKSTKKEMAAFPPEEDVQSMWSYRQLQASGKDQGGKTSHSPLHTGQFLPFIRVAIENYISTPQGSTIKPQQIPEAFTDLSKTKTPSHVDIPMRQYEKMERASRETCQILERLVFYKKAVSELNGRIQGLAEDAQNPTANVKEILETLITSNNMQSQIFDTIEYALETVLNQNMTMACNLSLAKRDALLKTCRGLSTDDTLLLRNSSFTDMDRFPHQLINQAENNVLKRASTSKQQSTTPYKKPRRDDDKQSSFRGYNSGRGRGSYRGNTRKYHQTGSRYSSRKQ